MRSVDVATAYLRHPEMLDWVFIAEQTRGGAACSA
jgi:hypothetical protein